ncbi:GPI mannosyltransferase 4 [Rhinophrynus dorsalis]
MNTEVSSKVIWGALSLLRVVWCLVPQPGYLHPDEFFQSPEVMAGDVLDLDINRPWEFHPVSPCRTVLIPLLTSGAAFWIIGILQLFGIKSAINSGYLLLVLPRLFITFLSFLLDYSVYHIAHLWRSDRWKAMELLAASYVTLVFYTRTTSNAIEGILFALILLFTSPGLVDSKASHLIGIVLAIGFFNRPTFLGFAFMPILYWAGKTNTSQFSFKSVFINILKLLPSVVATAIIFIIVDTIYYTGRFPFSFNCTQTFSVQVIQNSVLTPLNFLLYNLNPENLANHGAHPRITHLAVNGIMLFGILHLSVILFGIKMVKIYIFKLLHKNHTNYSEYKDSLTEQSNSTLLLFYFSPLVLLSLFSHQEPRFLIPLLLPLILLVAQHNITIRSKCVIFLFNVTGALFFGGFHQAGLVPSLLHIQQIVQSKSAQSNASNNYTLLFTHTYMPPKYLLSLKKGQTSVNIVDLAGFNEAQLCQKLKDIKTDLSYNYVQPEKQVKHHFFIVFPGTIAPVMDKCDLEYKGQNLFFPHLSMEDPPKVSCLFSPDVMNQLSLHVMEVNLYGLR